VDLIVEMGLVWELDKMKTYEQAIEISKYDQNGNLLKDCMCKTVKEHEKCFWSHSEYYNCKFAQSDLNLYFKCDNSKCKDFGKRYLYSSLLEMYSDYASWDCFTCKRKMIVTLEKLTYAEKKQMWEDF